MKISSKKVIDVLSINEKVQFRLNISIKEDENINKISFDRGKTIIDCI